MESKYLIIIIVVLIFVILIMGTSFIGYTYLDSASLQNITLQINITT